MNVINFGSELDGIPTASKQQRADARAYLLRHAPDLIEVVFGEAP